MARSARLVILIKNLEKPFSQSYYMQYPTMGINGPYGSKGFMGAPYKAYGVDEKDLGLGTSGEDSSESSSSRSQRRQQQVASAEEEAVVRESPSRRYEDGWRRSSYQNIYGRGAEQFQAQPELYGQQVSAAEWRQRLDTHEQQQRQRQRRVPYENYHQELEMDMQRARRNSHGDVIDLHGTPNSSVDERVRRQAEPLSAGSGDDSSYRHQQEVAMSPSTGAVPPAKRYHRRRSSEDSTNRHQRWPANIEERRARRTHSPAHSRPDPATPSYSYRSSSHHNLYQPNGKGSKHPPTYQYGDYFQ